MATCEAIGYLAYVQTREESVSTLAHLRWLLRGCPEGSPEIDWFAAELDFDQRFLANVELGTPA
jgi:hypothetical protein